MDIGQIIFLLLLIVVLYISAKLYSRIWRNIHLGKKESLRDQPARRIRQVLLVAFGQKKMFKRIVPAIFHLFIYLAFLLTQIELIEILLDGLTGRHRIFATSLGGFYTFVIGFIEILSVLALIATIAFIVRRVILKVARFQQPEMWGWPSRDALIILTLELVLIFGILTMNSADVVLQARAVPHFPDTGELPISGWLGPALLGGMETSTLIILERFGWWLHILVVFGFLIYLPISKHLHILLAFPNTYFARLAPKGKMKNMPEVMNEVKSMLGLTEEEDAPPMTDELPEFGAADVMDLSWKNVLDAYTCTECGRCTAECPANITGKKLSPRKIMMDVRDRAEEIGKTLDTNPEMTRQNYDDGKNLFDRITPEELHACTTCNACVEACPVLINPLDIILQMRRYEILTLASGPSDWTSMFNSMENTGAVWQVPEERDAWTKND
ncbi:(Fe-S)-binding protein [Membranicola marinus]|uniref:(Fe-S)-binding protein n=1 Tax=Membranihabitans marinus TaxID=1227546 RepID=A0A953HUA2_9BACT|nr:(Fe-S)-binding protein [Membranihabitans marinus]MBY5958435.1 (Fe-S)-binding protein [Membranihabitans marinus]